MITMMGLALGIDYALVVVQRFREELAAGRPVADAVAVTGRTANRAILTSGSTVVVSLLSMLIIPSTIMFSLGLGAVLVALTSVAAALTLVPAVLKLVGTRINAVPLRPRAKRGPSTGGAWSAIARGAVARPVLSAIGAIAVLFALAVPALSLRQGFAGVESLPEDNELRVSVERITDEFGYGSVTTFVVLTGDAVPAADVLAASMEADEAFTDVVVENGSAAAFPDGAAFVVARDVYEQSEAPALEALDRLRGELVPAALADSGIVLRASGTSGGDVAGGTSGGAAARGEVLVGGAVADSADFSSLMNDWFPWVVGAVLLVSFLILTVVFRSLAVPAMTLFVNALSVAAAYGLLVGTFQFGWGEALGFTQVDTIAPWLPLFLFAVLFGLSMDYHVFLLSRIREDYGTHGDPRRAISTGVRTTGALITGAALIMVAVFAGFASGDLTDLTQTGFGLGVAIILDATLVRVVLVPALLALLGKRAWTVPGWLAWLPAFAGEGAGAAQADLTLREAAAGEAAGVGSSEAARV
jgi:RND superfamily putative drug exporter